MEKTNIFFDLDGTLTDSMPGITRAVQYALKRYGIVEDDLEKLRPFVGPPLPESFKAYYQFSQEDADAAVYVFREYYNYVATSKPEDMAKRVLGHFGLTEYFTFIGGANDDSSRVEKDDVIRYVMENCGLSDRDSIIMVGDRRHDIAGAHKAGLAAVGVLYGYGSEKELSDAGAEWIVGTAAELLSLLKGL